MVYRMKDGRGEGDSWDFELVDVEVGRDRHGNPIEGAHVEITRMPERRQAIEKAPPSLKPSLQRLLDIINNALVDAGTYVTNRADVPANTKAITRDMLRRYCDSAGWWPTDNEHSRRTLLSRNLNDLAGKHVIGLTAEHVWAVRR